MNEDLISIIIPFYNTEKYITHCLESISQQTYTNFEALLIDDGSTDNSRQIAESYAKHDSRFKLLGGTHIGFPLAKNLGVENAKGKYIAFIDSDDFVENKYLEILYYILTSTGADISCCAYNTFFKEATLKRDLYNYTHKTIDIKIYDKTRFNVMLTDTVSTFMWNKLYKKELFNGVQCEDVIALSDTMTCYKLIEKANYIAVTSIHLINYRRHPENMSSTAPKSPEYWIHRFNVYLDLCYYLYTKYPLCRFKIKEKFRNECSRISFHIEQNILNELIKDPRVTALCKEEDLPKIE